MKKRTEGRFKADIDTVDFYKTYINSIAKNSIYDIKKSVYTNILKDINSSIMKKIVTTNFEYYMSPKLGHISVRKYKIKLKLDEQGKLIKSCLPIDFHKTNLLWEADEESRINKKVVYYTNDHTDGYQYKFYWNKRQSNVPNKSYYNFKAVRDNNRMINTALKTIENLDFFEYKTNFGNKNGTFK